MFSFFKSYYVDDTAFIILSRGEVIAASKLIVSHFCRFGLTIHTGSKRKNEKSKTEAIHFPKPGQESSAADMEDIEINDDRFMSICVKFKYLGSYFVPELNDTADITERISQARKLLGFMNKQLLSNKNIPSDIRRRLYQVIVVNIAFLGSESWALKEANRSKLEAFHHGRMCGLTMGDVAEKWITNEHVGGMLADSPITHNRLVDGNAKMLMALQTQCNETVKISEANAWRMVYNVTTSRETPADHTTCIHKYPQEARL